MENKIETAVEYLLENIHLINSTKWNDIIEKAKAMEKDQIICARMNGMTDNELSYINAEKYYNETYGTK